MRRALQLVVLAKCLQPLAVGSLGLLWDVEFYIPAEGVSPNLDSQFRFMSGWDVGLSIIAWWIVPRIESQTALFRIVCFAVFLGGLGRIAAWHLTGRQPLLSWRLRPKSCSSHGRSRLRVIMNSKTGRSHTEVYMRPG